ncbi:MAG: sugar phosphate isomerase/epimerase, partial [Acidobacteriota bacterium]
GRTTSIHVKPYSSKDPAAYIADDELDWPTIIRLCQTTAGTEWYIIEFEVPGIPPLEAIRENYKRFKALL